MHTTFYRDQLHSDREKLYYDIIYKAVKGDHPQEKIDLPVADSTDASADAFVAVRAICFDHPELFYIGNTYHANNCSNQCTLTLTILYTPGQIRRMRRVMDLRLRCLTAGVMHLPPWERERIIYERIRRMLSYEDRGKWYDHNIVGPLMQGVGVCQGFSHLVILAMRRVGIPCIYVHGKANKEDTTGHSWNMVWLGSQSYHLDITWEHIHEKGGIAFAYFNLTDEQIRRDHIIETDGLPACNDPSFGYHSYTGTLFSTRDALSAYLQNAFQAGSGPFTIRMEPQCDMKEIISSIISELPQGLYWHTTFQKQSTAIIWRDESPK